MEQVERKKYILKQLEMNDKVTLKELSRRFDVSEMTIRRDFNELEMQGLLIRKYGGAVKSEAAESLFSFNKRVESNRKQKQLLCRIAEGYIDDGDIIFIDCGTTLFRLAGMVRNRKIRVITNSLPVVSELMGSPTVKLTLVGGTIDSDRQASYGSIAEAAIREFSADKAFIGTDGISLLHGLSSYDEKEALITRTMAEHSRQVFLLCDSSKIERDSYFRYAPVTLVHYLITDKLRNESLIQQYKEQGIQIVTQ